MINRQEFDLVCNDLDHGVPLNLRMIGKIFGQDFWELLVLCLVDSKEAQRQLLDKIDKNG